MHVQHFRSYSYRLLVFELSKLRFRGYKRICITHEARGDILVHFYINTLILVFLDVARRRCYSPHSTLNLPLVCDFSMLCRCKLYVNNNIFAYMCVWMWMHTYYNYVTICSVAMCRPVLESPQAASYDRCLYCCNKEPSACFVDAHCIYPVYVFA